METSKMLTSISLVARSGKLGTVMPSAHALTHAKFLP